MLNDNLIFELSVEGRKAYSLPACDVPEEEIDTVIPEKYLRKSKLNLPEVSEIDVVRHFTALSKLNFGVDSGFYPLGSCTMKYNPKLNEEISQSEAFTGIHPLQPENTIQGILELLYQTENFLSEITGMDKTCLHPAAGAHGEMTGLMLIKAYHESRGDHARDTIIVPDSAHGTNPASASMVGFKVLEIASDKDGLVDIQKLKSIVNENTAGLMLTNPNTLGLFEKNIKIIAEIVHNAGGLLYYDGANANAILGISRPGDMGFDVAHLNLHKTFSTPHGGGGPGSGPICVKKELVPFLPVPIIEFTNDNYTLNYDFPNSIGKVKSFYGNINVVIKAYSYILSLGAEGLKKISQNAVLNANYLLKNINKLFKVPYGDKCMHEFVASASSIKQEFDVSAMDIAKRLIDFGTHPPTVYFPLIVGEALMIEPTESESKETLDNFLNILEQIAKEIKENPEIVKNAPHSTKIRRPDEVKAARMPKLRYEF